MIHNSLMYNHPPLPENWPFKAREATLILNDCGIHSLYGFGEGWHLFSAEDPALLNELNQTTTMAECPSRYPTSAIRHASLDDIFGRGGLIKTGDYILRPYRRGGFLRHFNKETYFSYRRFMAEYEIHSALWCAGFPTVQPVGFAFRKHMWGVQGVYVTRLADARPWPKMWADDFVPEQVARVADLIFALSSWGLWAPDLNATNLLWASDGRFLALDWDKAAWVQCDNLTEKYRLRLLRSMVKLCAPPAIIDLMQEKLMGGLCRKTDQV